MASGFVSSKELDDQRKQRQEEWEKVRKPDDPLKAPEPEVCNKTLFEQLRDNREAKEAEIAEQKKMRNMIRGVDEDESDFLAQVDSLKQEAIRNSKKEEAELMKEMAAARCVTIEETSQSEKVQSTIQSVPPQKSKQASILSTAIKRKLTSDEPQSKSARIETSDSNGEKPSSVEPATSAMKVIGIIPGVGHYDSDSSDTDSDSSDTDIIPTLKVSRPQKSCEDRNGS